MLKSETMPIDQVLTEAKDKMTKSESAMMHEFDGVRTGKANPALVENIMAEAYGSTMRLRDMAGITTPETRTILIQPWDAGTVDPINKAIQSANLGLNPSIDGKVIRITLPELSQERREELVKVAKKITEDGRVAVRHVRRDALEGLKKCSKESGVSEDEIKTAEKEVQKLTDDFIKKIESHLTDKEKEILIINQKHGILPLVFSFLFFNLWFADLSNFLSANHRLKNRKLIQEARS